MSRARDLANSADNDISGTLTVDDITLSGNITVGGTVDGRDLAADGSKLDGVEANATADQTGAEIKTAYEGEANTNAYTDAEKTKLSGIEAGADVTDTANVTASGALMDSEVTNLAQVKAFDSSDYATAAQGTTADAALARSGGTMTGAITFASGQTFDGRDVSADGSKLDGIESGATADQTITAGSGLTGGGTGNVTLSHADTSSQASVNNSGATVVQDVTVDTYGHVTGLGSKTMTLADLGYTGATNANYITNNNQLTNGAGYTTFTANQSLNTTSSPTFSNPNLTSALRMGGTQVLSSGRALTNITSVDATTVAALGAAGVGGGATKLITANTSLGTASTYSFPLTTRYRQYVIQVNTIQHTGSGGTKLRCRLTDTSNNALTGTQSYHWKYYNNNISEGGDVDYGEVSKIVYQQPSYNGYNSFIFRITNAHTSSMPTMIEWQGFSGWFTVSQEQIFTGFLIRRYKEVNNAFYLYAENLPYGYNLTNGYYSMWGVDI